MFDTILIALPNATNIHVRMYPFQWCTQCSFWQQQGIMYIHSYIRTCKITIQYFHQLHQVHTYMHVRTYVCVVGGNNVHVAICIIIRTCMYIHVHSYVLVLICIVLYTTSKLRIYIHTYTYIHTYIHVHTCTCNLRICMIHVYTYIHTYIHMRICRVWMSIWRRSVCSSHDFSSSPTMRCWKSCQKLKTPPGTTIHIYIYILSLTLW